MNLGIMKVMSNLNICDFDRVLSHWFPSQQEGAPTQVWLERPGIERGMGGAGPSQTQM